MSPIIKKNKKINFDESQIYITTKDNQTVADIVIYEGEKEKVKDNLEELNIWQELKEELNKSLQ